MITPDNLGVVLFGGVVVVTVFWMVVGWRAMKAHEKLARNSDDFVEALRAWWRERQFRRNPRSKIEAEDEV